MGILEGKRILVAGVTMDSSIGFAVARTAQEQGATVVISNFGRALGITRRIAGRLPEPAPVIELDVSDDEHLATLGDRLREHVDGLDGLVHSIAYGNPETVLGGGFLGAPWADVAQAVQVSGYSLAAVTEAVLPMLSRGSSVVGMTFDATVAWPAYNWMGVAKASLESTARYLARDLGEQGIRVNCIAPGQVWTPMAAAHMSPARRAERERSGLIQTEGTAWDIGWAAVFLASDESRWVTGQVLVIDAGVTLTVRGGTAERE